MSPSKRCRCGHMPVEHSVNPRTGTAECTGCGQCGPVQSLDHHFRPCRCVVYEVAV